MSIINCQNYSITIGSQYLSRFSEYNYSKVAVLIDENTQKHCLDLFIQKSKLQNFTTICIPSGEQHKNISHCQTIWEVLTQQQFDRASLLVNLGGGVIGDMGGFAASCYKRGIDFIHVPTTLLSMVDASIGGKLGIDFLNLKNQIGLFKNPKAVYIDPHFLKTLPKRQILSGYAEVVKHALISDSTYWNFLKHQSIDQLNWEDVIYKGISLKKNIVEQDPYDENQRKKLNFGHSLGHAIESFFLSKNFEILHGEAIALGMLLESKLSNINHEELEDINRFLNSTFKIPKKPRLKELLPFLKQDKKNEKETLLFTLLESIGTCKINCPVDENRLKAIF